MRHILVLGLVAPSLLRTAYTRLALAAAYLVAVRWGDRR